jgi:hypothetical protein
MVSRGGPRTPEVRRANFLVPHPLTEFELAVLVRRARSSCVDRATPEEMFTMVHRDASWRRGAHEVTSTRAIGAPWFRRNRKLRSQTARFASFAFALVVATASPSGARAGVCTADHLSTQSDAGVATSCLPYLCAPNGDCAQTCADTRDCAVGFSCATGSRTCLRAATTCSSDGMTVIDMTGMTTSCAPYRCMGDGECARACASTRDCAADAACDTASHSCLSACTADSQCGNKDSMCGPEHHCTPRPSSGCAVAQHARRGAPVAFLGITLLLVAGACRARRS